MCYCYIGKMNIDNIKYIRSLLGDEEIEESQLFTNEEIKRVIENAESENHALYILYLQKAGKYAREENYIKTIKAGGEELQRLTAIELSNLAYNQAEKYKELYELEKQTGGFFIY